MNKKNVLKGVLYGCLSTTLICIVLYVSTANISGSAAVSSPHYSFHEPVSLNNDNIVDYFVQNANTKYLYKVNLERNKLQLQFKLPNHFDIEEQISLLLPQYLKLVFYEVQNVTELKLHFIVHEEAGLEVYTISVDKEASWLYEDWSFLQERGWLNDEQWRNQLKISTHTIRQN